MADELAWRKFPRSTASSPELDYISFCMEPQYVTAPYMFFMVMYCRADDEGVFDLEDGVIFARQMKCNSLQVVYKVAEMLEQRRVITRVNPQYHVYMITDWDPPERRGVRPTKTMEQRRAEMDARIQRERAARTAPAPVVSFAPEFKPQTSFQNFPDAQNFQQPPSAFCSQAPQPAAAPVNFDELRAIPETRAADFFCPDFDKNAKIVEQTEREREINRDIETHTERPRETEDKRETERPEERDAKQPSGPIAGPTGNFAEEKQDTAQTAEPRQVEILREVFEPAPNEPKRKSEQVEKNEEEAKLQESYLELEEIANRFFAKNCLGYEPAEHQTAIDTLIRRVFKLRSKVNPAATVLKAVLNQYKYLSDNPKGHFAGSPITPEYILKAGIWAHVLQNASKILMTTHENQDAWLEQLGELDVNKKAEEIDSELESQCRKYGIDPNSPTRAAEILTRQALERSRTG